MGHGPFMGGPAPASFNIKQRKSFVPRPTGPLDPMETSCGTPSGSASYLRSSFKELRNMHDSRQKFDKVFGWAAFLASYLLVVVLISLPFSDRGTNEQPQTSKGEIASLLTD